MHCEVLPSRMKARCALFMMFGCSSIIWPMRTDSSFDETFPNSCRTEIGLISPIKDVYEPSSLRFGTIEIMALRQDLGVHPLSSDSLISDTIILSNGVGSFSVSESSTRRRIRSQLTPSMPAALLVS